MCTYFFISLFIFSGKTKTDQENVDFETAISLTGMLKINF
jgi:hypothetical protein